MVTPVLCNLHKDQTLLPKTPSNYGHYPVSLPEGTLTVGFLYQVFESRPSIVLKSAQCTQGGCMLYARGIADDNDIVRCKSMRMVAIAGHVLEVFNNARSNRLF